MSTEQNPHDDEIQFLASLPPSAGAIAIDGESHGGGRVRLDIPGTDLASLLRLTMLRGRVLLVTIAPQQAVLPLGPAAPDGEATAFPKDALFQDPLGEQAERIVPIPGDGVIIVTEPIASGLPAHVHRYQGEVCVDCGAPLEGLASGTKTKPRKVRRGLIPKGRAKVKR